MDFTLENFDFKVDTLTTVAEIDQLLEEQALQIKGFEVKLSSRELQSDKSEYRSENLDQEIAEVQAIVTSKETELAALTSGTRTHENVAIELDSSRARLRRLNFRKSDTLSALSLVDKNIDTGEAQLLLLFYTSFKIALEQRKTAL
jgi:hypothetical protein